MCPCQEAQRAMYISYNKAYKHMLSCPYIKSKSSSVTSERENNAAHPPGISFHPCVNSLIISDMATDTIMIQYTKVALPDLQRELQELKEQEVE